MKILKFSPLFIMLFSVQCAKKEQNTNANAPTPPTAVDVIICQEQKFSREIEANGSVLAKEFVELHPEVSGRLIYLNIPEGESVEKGTILAKINNSDLEAQLQGYQSQLELATKTEKRLAQLLTLNGVNQSDYDVALNQLNNLKSSIAYTQALIDKTIIKAPFSGVIGLRQVSQGAYVTPNTVFATLQQINELKIDFTLSENVGKDIKKGMQVEVLFDNASERREKATIIAIEPQVSATTRNIKMRALIKGININPGSFAKVYLPQGINKSNILIPSNAIIPEDQSKTVVVVKDGKAKFTKIVTGDRQEALVEVLSGLENGDSLVVAGVLFVKPDASLKVKKVKTLAELSQPL